MAYQKPRHQSSSSSQDEYYEQVVYINRVAKVVKGGKNFRFTALVVVGDRKGKVGYALGKAREVPTAIQKAMARARRDLRPLCVWGATIPSECLGIHRGGRVFLRPASPGTGVIAGGAVRAVMEAAGIRDVLTKSIGSSNPANVLKATLNALDNLRDPRLVSKLRGKSLEEMEVDYYGREDEIQNTAVEPEENVENTAST